MKRETIFLGFFSLLLALGFDAICHEGHAGIIIWLAFVALWGVCSHLTLTQRLERYREELRRMRDNGDTSTTK